MKIGICGGTFDPFHRGHLDPILAVRSAMSWDRVIYVPAWVQPFKQDRETASPYHRFAMAALATEGLDDVYVSPWELERGAVSYSVETLRHLRSLYSSAATLDWIIGGDNLDTLLDWKDIEEIFTLSNFVVLSRESEGALPVKLQSRVNEATSRSTHGSIVFAENPQVPVSATRIRLRVAEGESIEDLVAPRVSRYIHHYGLYRKGHT